MQKEYLNQLKEVQSKELTKHSQTIEKFRLKFQTKGIDLTEENFCFAPTIGVIAQYPNIVNILNHKVREDKEGLVNIELLDSLFKRNRFAPGFYFESDYMIMAHPFFRRGFYEQNNFSPSFIELFWSFHNPKLDSYISIDFNRVRINVDATIYRELDTWFGANFNRDINKINDGISRLCPPSNLDDFIISFYFGSAYALDIKWETKDKIKTFQAEEFKNEKVKISLQDKEYYPVRYIHSEFNTEANNFRHFDGAVHLYTEEEYFKRRDSDFNFNKKNTKHIKTKSIKLFKFNGEIDINTWIEFTSHFFSGNPLIIEYFETDYPQYIKKIIEQTKY